MPSDDGAEPAELQGHGPAKSESSTGSRGPGVARRHVVRIVTRRRLAWAVLISAGSIIASYYGLFLLDVWRAHQALWAPSVDQAYPHDLADFVARSDLIFEGQVIRTTFLGYSVDGYDASGRLTIAFTSTEAMPLVTLPANSIGFAGPAVVYQRTTTLPAVPYTDYTVRVEKVFLGAPDVAVDDRVVVRVKATPDGGSVSGDLAPSFPGDAYLFAVSIEPDHRSHGLVFGAASRLDLSGSRVRTTNVARDAITFSDTTSVSEFLESLASEIPE